MRRAGGGVGAGSGLLPLSEQDLVRTQQPRRVVGGSSSFGNGGGARPGYSRRVLKKKRGKGSRNRDGLERCLQLLEDAFDRIGGWGKLLLPVLSLGLVVFLIRQVGSGNGAAETTGQQQQQHHASTTRRAAQHDAAAGKGNEPALPLQDEFPSLRYAFSNSKLVGLYFGAAWCPMTTPVSRLLDEHFRDVLLPPPPPGDNGNNAVERPYELSIVYVSSDSSEEEMNGYLSGRNWIAVPYDSPDRQDLKRRYKTCAKIELEQLGIQRKHEIPTLIVIDAASQQVLTFNGAKDVEERGRDAMKTWRRLQSLSAALDAKFQHADDAGEVA